MITGLHPATYRAEVLLSLHGLVPHPVTLRRESLGRAWFCPVMWWYPMCTSPKHHFFLDKFRFRPRELYVKAVLLHRIE